jgi:hypothetical protein
MQKRYSATTIPALLAALEAHAQAGSHTYQLIQNVLSAKLAEQVHNGPHEGPPLNFPALILEPVLYTAAVWIWNRIPSGSRN